MSKIRRIAITGASGFIGRHLVAALRARGAEPVLAGRDPDRLAALAPGANVVRLDIADPHPGDFERLGAPQCLVHLAWDGLPNYRSPRHFETELPQQYRFLKALVGDGLKHLLITGTCFEYGLQSGGLTETQPAQPITVYGFAKDALRRQLEFLRQTQPFELTWARLFYTYGEGQAPTSLLPQLAAAAARGDTHFAMSSGEQLRDYLPVKDVAARLAALGLRESGAGIVNVCSGKPVSVRSLVESWIAENGWRITLDRGKYPIPDYEPMAFWGDDAYFNSLF